MVGVVLINGLRKFLAFLEKVNVCANEDNRKFLVWRCRKIVPI